MTNIDFWMEDREGIYGEENVIVMEVKGEEVATVLGSALTLSEDVHKYELTLADLQVLITNLRRFQDETLKPLTLGKND